jgi:hypothetical protein
VPCWKLQSTGILRPYRAWRLSSSCSTFADEHSYLLAAAYETEYLATELETFHQLEKRAVGCCQRIWDIVRDILCDDSPEGHVPEDLEDLEDLDTKSLLSYSFRAIDESRCV